MSINKDKLLQDLKSWQYAYVNAYIDEAANKITEFAKKSIIELFYNSYTPLYYNRMFELRDSSCHRYKHFNGKIAYGGVKVNASDMDYAKGNAEQVLGMTFFNGYHGSITKEYQNPDYYIGKHYTEPPVNVIEELIRDKEFLNYLNEYATSQAKREKYNVLVFDK